MVQEFPKYLVSINCFTYNHSKYIRDALNGFVMQKINFPFIILLVDDASTDGEQDVIRSYVNEHFEVGNHDVAYEKETDDAYVTYAQHKTNRNCYIVVHYLKYNHYQIKKKKVPYLAEWRNQCKYEALCEGDDYWTDSLKLQKQVDFLEANPEYSMCFHNAIEHFEHKNIDDRLFSKIKDKDYTGKYIFKNWIIPTASVVYRREVLESDLYRRVLQCKDFIYGDTPLFVTCAELGKIRGLSDVMSVYRRNEGGVTQKEYNYDMKIRFFFHQLAFSKIFNNLYLSSQYFSANYIVQLFFHLLRKRDKRVKDVLIYLGEVNLLFILIAFFLFPINYTKARISK